MQKNVDVQARHHTITELGAQTHQFEQGVLTHIIHNVYISCISQYVFRYTIYTPHWPSVKIITKDKTEIAYHKFWRRLLGWTSTIRCGHGADYNEHYYSNWLTYVIFSLKAVRNVLMDNHGTQEIQRSINERQWKQFTSVWCSFVTPSTVFCATVDKRYAGARIGFQFPLCDPQETNRAFHLEFSRLPTNNLHQRYRRRIHYKICMSLILSRRQVWHCFQASWPAPLRELGLSRPAGWLRWLLRSLQSGL